MADGGLTVWLSLGVWLIAMVISLSALGLRSTAVILLCSLPSAGLAAVRELGGTRGDRP